MGFSKQSKITRQRSDDSVEDLLAMIRGQRKALKTKKPKSCLKRRKIPPSTQTPESALSLISAVAYPMGTCNSQQSSTSFFKDSPISMVDSRSDEGTTELKKLSTDYFRSSAEVDVCKTLPSTFSMSPFCAFAVPIGQQRQTDKRKKVKWAQLNKAGTVHNLESQTRSTQAGKRVESELSQSLVGLEISAKRKKRDRKRKVDKKTAHNEATIMETVDGKSKPSNSRIKRVFQGIFRGRDRKRRKKTPNEPSAASLKLNTPDYTSGKRIKQSDIQCQAKSQAKNAVGENLSGLPQDMKEEEFRHYLEHLERARKYVLQARILLSKATDFKRIDSVEVENLTLKAYAYANEAKNLVVSMHRVVGDKALDLQAASKMSDPLLIRSGSSNSGVTDRIYQEDMMRRLEGVSLFGGESMTLESLGHMFACGDSSLKNTQVLASETDGILNVLAAELQTNPTISAMSAAMSRSAAQIKEAPSTQRTQNHLVQNRNQWFQPTSGPLFGGSNPQPPYSLGNLFGSMASAFQSGIAEHGRFDELGHMVSTDCSGSTSSSMQSTLESRKLLIPSKKINASSVESHHHSIGTYGDDAPGSSMIARENNNTVVVAEQDRSLNCHTSSSMFNNFKCTGGADKNLAAFWQHIFEPRMNGGAIVKKPAEQGYPTSIIVKSMSPTSSNSTTDTSIDSSIFDGIEINSTNGASTGTGTSTLLSSLMHNKACR